MRNPLRRKQDDGFTEIPAAPGRGAGLLDAASIRAKALDATVLMDGDASFHAALELLGPGVVEVTAQGDAGRRYLPGRQAEELVARQARAYALYRDAWWAGTKGAGGCPPAGSGGALPASRLRPLEPHGRDQDPERITMATQEQERGLRGFRPTPDQRTFVSNILIWLWVITLSFTFAIGVAACYSVG